MIQNNVVDEETNRIPILSFFTGGGFLDIGFEEVGFNIIWTNELNSNIADMYESAMTSWRHLKDVSVENASISSRLSITELNAQAIMNDSFGNEKPPLFGVIGGPPCVDFSIGGKNLGANGPNGRLLKVFANVIQELKPDFFVIENVPGLKKVKKHGFFLKKVVRELKKRSHYHITLKIINSLEYGVPQNRERLFIIGFSDKLFQKRFKDKPDFNPVEWFDWPKPKFPEAKQLPWPSASPFNETPDTPFGIPEELMVDHLFSGNNGLPDPETISNGLDFFNPYSPKFTQIKEGDDSRKSFKRLHRYRYSPTVWYGNNEVHLHPWKPRRLSVRETLRIQTVPDTYVLPQEYSLTAKFRLITNGVPCKLANAVATSVIEFLQPVLHEQQ